MHDLLSIAVHFWDRKKSPKVDLEIIGRTTAGIDSTDAGGVIFERSNKLQDFLREW